jgi:hypothetical protein
LPNRSILIRPVTGSVLTDSGGMHDDRSSGSQAVV